MEKYIPEPQMVTTYQPLSYKQKGEIHTMTQNFQTKSYQKYKGGNVTNDR